MHSVGLSKAHEMCSKTSINRPNKDNIHRLVQFFLYIRKSMKNLKDQLMIKASKIENVFCTKYNIISRTLL